VRAPHGHNHLRCRHDKREDQREMSDLDDHTFLPWTGNAGSS
jgi:hypothetical protein